MDAALLREEVEHDLRDGHRPILVVGTAGSVSTGAVDPLPEMAAICRAHMVCGFTWMAPMEPWRRVYQERPRASARSARPIPLRWTRTSGSTRHWKPAACLCAMPMHCDERFLITRAYYQFDEHVVNYFDCGPQNSRGFRALKVWLSRREAGRDGHCK